MTTLYTVHLPEPGGMVAVRIPARDAASLSDLAPTSRLSPYAWSPALSPRLAASVARRRGVSVESLTAPRAVRLSPGSVGLEARLANEAAR